MIAQLFQIAMKDLRLRVRDRSVFIIGLLTPALLALIFSSVFGDALDPSVGFSTTYGVVELDSNSGLREALGGLEAGGQFEILELASVSAAEEAIDNRLISAAFVVPEGFRSAIPTGEAAIEVIADVDAPISAGIAESVAQAYAGAIDQVSLTVAASLAAGVEMTAAQQIAEQGLAAPRLARLGSVEAVVRQMDGATYAMAGMAVFFLFFTVQFGVSSLLEERRLGTWDRLLSSPVRRGTVIGAKAMVSFILGVVSMTVLMIGASLGLGATWGDPFAVALLVVFGVLAATGIMSVVAAFAKTEEGAGNMQSVIAVSLGMLGGTFVPITGDGLVAKLSLVTPHAWFLRGLNELAGGGGVERILPSLVAIGLFAVITGGAAALLFRREAGQ